MTKRKRNSDDEEEEEEEDDEDDIGIENDAHLKAVFVDTSLDTHLVVLVSPLLSFSLLKDRIVKEHSKCFPDFGEIKINALKVKREQNYYHLSERMPLKIAFHGLEGWFVFADVAGTPFKKPHPNSTNQKLDPHSHENFESDVAKNHSSGGDTGRRGKTRKRAKMETTGLEALASNFPIENTLKLDNNNAPKASPLDTKAAGTDTAKRSSELPGQSEGTGKTSGSNLNQEREVHNNEVSRSRDKGVKRKKKDGDDEVDKSRFTTLGQGSDIMRNEDNGKSTLERDLDGIITEDMGTPDIPSSQRKASYSVEREAANDEDVTSLKTSELKATESGNPSKKRETSKAKSISTEKQDLSGVQENNDLESTNITQKGVILNEVTEDNHPGAASGSRAKKNKKNKKDDDGANKSRTVELGRVPDMPNGVTAMDSETPDNKRTADEEIMKSVDTPAKKKKKHNSKTSVAENQDLSSHRHNNEQESADVRQEVAEVSQPGNVTKPEQSADTMSKSRAKSPSKQKTHLGNSSGLPIKEQSNKKTEENVAPETVTDDHLRENGTHDDTANVVSANVTEGTKVDKRKASKKKTKKSKENEEPSEAVPQITNNNLEAAGTGEIGAESLQPARSSISENSELPTKAIKNKKTEKSKENEKTSDVAPQTMNDNLEAAGTGEIGAELLQPAKSSKTEENIELPKKASKNKKTKKSKENEKTSDVAPQTMNDNLEAAGTGEIGAESLQLARISKSEENSELLKKTSKNKKTKTSKENEKTSDVVPQIMNDNLEAAGTGEIGAESLQPARSSKSEEHSELPKKRSKSKQTTPAIDVPEIPVTDQVRKGKQADDSGNKNQSKVGDLEREHVNESIQTVDAHEADMVNPEKQKTKKSKRKKLDQSPAVDASSNLMTPEKGNENERTSLVDHQLQSDVPEAKQMTVPGVKSFQPPQDNNPEVNVEIQNDKPKKKQKKKHSASEKDLSDLSVKQQSDIETQKTLVEQADDVVPRINVHEPEKLEVVSQHQKRPDDSTEVSKLDNQPANKLKGKKFDVSSSVDTSSNGCNLTTSKKRRESEKNVQVGSELQNDAQESELSSQIGTKPSQLPQASQVEKYLDSQSPKVKQMVPPKETLSANVLSEVDGSNGVDKHGKGTSLPEEHNDPDEIHSHEVSSGLPKKSGKPKASKQKIKTLDLSTSRDAESKGENVAASNKKDPIVNNSPDGSQLLKSVIKRGHNLKPCSTTSHSTNLKGMNAQVPTGDAVSTRAGGSDKNNTVGKNNVPRSNVEGSRSSETSSLVSGSSAKRTLGEKNNKEVQKKNNQEHDFKTPSNKIIGVPVNAVPQKKHVPPTSGGLFGDLSSDSSDSEVERNGSSSSTRTPDDISSSDYSEGESKGEVVTSQHDAKGGGSAGGKTNVTISALKDMSLESVLRSSRRYKNAKLMASQSQMEDGESEPPEFVPDSLPD
ncbi:hypothetical protein vseg_020065 [Gypsophila vaccaria]